LKLPTATLSIRIPHESWEKLAQFVDNGLAKDISCAVRALIEAGFWLHEHKNDIHDPEQVQNFIEEWNSQMNEDKIFDWTKQLSENQMKAIEMAFDLEKERRYKL